MPVIDLSSIAQLKSQISQLQAMFNALSHPTGIGGIATGLGSTAIRNLLPNSSQLGRVVGGSTNSWALSGQAQQYLQQNQVYQPQGNDFQAQQMRQAAQSNANIQALAANANTALQGRMQELDQIEKDCVNTANDVTQISACNARLQAEQNFVAGEQAQLVSLQTMAQQQKQIQDEQYLENRRKSIEQYYNDTQPGGGTQQATPADSCSFCG
jgi:hypothetical protein